MKRFRTVKEDHRFPYTVGGQTYVVSEPHEVKQVVQPKDLDEIVARSLAIVTFTVVLGAITWSTVAIGTLLSSMAPTWVSYLVAVIFDMTWAACMGAEWLMRYDKERAWLPRTAGWVALAVSVLTIALEGAMATGKPVIGAAGGLVSILAKGLWMVTMNISARRLSALDQQWYEKAASAASAELARTVMERKLARTRALVEQERAALDTFQSQPRIAATEPFEQVPVDIPAGPHQNVVYVVRNGDRVKIGTSGKLADRVKALSLRRSDVLLAVTGSWELESELRQRFAEHRIGTTEWFSFVPEIRDFVTDTVSDVLVPERDAVVSAPMSSGTVVQLSGGRPGVTSCVRDILSADPDMSDEAVLSSVRRVLGPDTKADTVRKSIKRVKEAS